MRQELPLGSDPIPLGMQTKSTAELVWLLVKVLLWRCEVWEGVLGQPGLALAQENGMELLLGWEGEE